MYLPLDRRPANDFYEMEMVGDNRMLVGVAIQAPAELKKRILGAIKSYHASLSSIDYTIKKYGERWNFAEPSEDEVSLVRTLKAIDERVSNLIDDLAGGSARPDRIGLFEAESALIRLKPTFRSALILISQGYAFEAAALVRVILEQVAWAFAVHGSVEHDKVAEQSPTAAISILKKHAAVAGRLYGALSKQAHLDARLAQTYIVQDPEGAVEIRFRLTVESRLILGYLIAVLGLFRSVALSVSGAYFTERPEVRVLGNFETTSEKLASALAMLRRAHEELQWLPINPLHTDARPSIARG